MPEKRIHDEKKMHDHFANNVSSPPERLRKKAHSVKM